MPTLTPYLCCRDAAQAIQFYVDALGAEETMRLAEPNGRIGHAELRLGAAAFFVSDEYPDHGALSPQALDGTPVTLHLYVDDVDAAVARAAAAGAVVERAPQDQFYGDRSATIRDPFGHRWMVATRREVLSADEVARRYRALMTPQA